MGRAGLHAPCPASLLPPPSPTSLARRSPLPPRTLARAGHDERCACERGARAAGCEDEEEEEGSE
eukprot:1377522-Rhodomonas_salina.1